MSGDRRAAWIAAIVATVMVSQLVASLAVRDGFFLSEFDAESLPTMVLVSTVLSAAFLLTMARVLRSVAPARSMPFLFGASAAMFALEWLLASWRPGIAAISLYIHVFTLGAVVVSSFWSVVNERFDPHAAKRVFARVGGGASFGGVLGGVAVFGGASFADIPTMLLALAGLNAICAVAVTQIGAGAHRPTPEKSSARSAFRIIRNTPYLQHLGLLVALGAFCQGTYDYVLKSTAAEQFASSAELVSFFGLFYTSVNVLTFLIQNGLGKIVLERLGISAAVGSMPGAGAVLGVIGLLFPGLPTAAAMRGGIGVTENSLFRSGYELLYTPVLPEKKRPTKLLIDIGGDDVGTALGAGFTVLVLQLLPTQPNPLLVLAGIAASLGGLAVTRQLHRGYVWSLAESLRAGRIDVGEVEIVDATMQHALSELATTLPSSRGGESQGSSDGTGGDSGIDRAALIRRLRAERGNDTSPVAAPTPARTPYRAPPEPEVAPGDLDGTTRAIAHLRSGDVRRAKHVLLDPAPLPGELVVHVVPLLANEALRAFAEDSLRRVAAASTGTLLDVARQSRAGLPVRRAICSILAELPTQRCARGLMDLLDDRSFEIRLRAAAGLLKIHRRNRELAIPPERIFDAAHAEAKACARRWRSSIAMDERISRVPPSESKEGRRVVHGLSYVWTLLPLALDPKPLSLAIRALTEPSGAHRGTGLEYLENVLPPKLLVALRPLIADHELVERSLRSPEQLAELDVSEAEPFDLSALRRHIDAIRSSRAQPPHPA